MFYYQATRNESQKIKREIVLKISTRNNIFLTKKIIYESKYQISVGDLMTKKKMIYGRRFAYRVQPLEQI